MANKSYICRHCGESFIAKPGKPGYINECPECLHAKTAKPKSIENRIQEIIDTMSHPKDRRKYAGALRRSLIDSGIPEESVDKLILGWLEVSAGLRERENAPGKSR